MIGLGVRSLRIFSSGRPWWSCGMEPVNIATWVPGVMVELPFVDSSEIRMP